MKLFLRLAARNLGRRPVRTLLTMSAMAGATALLVVALGLLYGMIWDMVASATETYYGHAVVTAERYLDRHRIQLTMDQDEPPEAVLDHPEVTGRAARVRGFMLLSAGEGEESQTQPAEVLGIDPEAERGVSRLPKRVAEGRFLSGLKGGEIVLGRGLARRLGAKIGTEIAAMGQAADGSIAAELFTVTGILETGDKLRDTSLALVGREDLQAALSLEGRVHEWVLALKQPLQAKLWAEAIKEAVKGRGVEVSPWDRFLPQMSEMIEMTGVYRTIYAVIFYFAVVLVTMNTMYMALHERVREFAIMGAVGLKPTRLASLLIIEALYLSLASAIAGGAIGAAWSHHWNVHPLDFRESFTSLTWVGASIEPVFRTAPGFEHVLFPVLMTALIGIVVALLPAFKLYRLRPVEVLREV
ncbi:MAG: FtsX-like permease family protein [Elusimicrobiota bacterium]